MISILAGIFIGRNPDIKDQEVRKRYGMLCSIVGIAFNILLFAFKELAGFITGSMAIVADGFNNLSDAGSSFLTMLGYKFAGAEPDTEHPFGHGRIEYVMGLIVSIVIIIVGIELFQNSFDKLLHPEAVEVSLAAGIILVISILIKIYMYIYNSAIAKKIDSSAMQATAADSLSDVLSTTVVLVSMIILYLTGRNVDAVCGLAVSLFIMYQGCMSAKETIEPLLGQPPKMEFVDDVYRIIAEHKEILGTHDLVVHDYGPGRVMMSIHAEVDGEGDIYELHDCIDLIERELHDRLGCEAVIHMDPINKNDEVTEKMKKRVLTIVQAIDAELTIHDFRMVPGNTHTNLIFDVVVPPKFGMHPSELKKRIEKDIQAMGTYIAVVQVDQKYV
ncbi:MAG: cation diffusion facilitator family transporter [Lachnospiraceae bacterium]|nr:cation diffusion facilitator family transporter [Lachnospiraceae bacterium]